ncbi:MAG TPA: hypothetical protein VHZ96_09970 [Frankiaceae bacterium]|nr:hypothetical protein [Frankiaceae bacterium]
MFFRRGPDTAEHADPASPTPARPTEAQEHEAAVVAQVRTLRQELADIVTKANADGGRLPPGAVPTVRDIDDVLRPLLSYIEARSASEEEMRHLTAIIHDYLPTALNDFCALPPQYAERPGVTGTTPADDLLQQLVLLDEGANDLQDLVYTGDAAQLAIQARFLDAKFRRSDLDS